MPCSVSHTDWLQNTAVCGACTRIHVYHIRDRMSVHVQLTVTSLVQSHRPADSAMGTGALPCFQEERNQSDQLSRQLVVYTDVPHVLMSHDCSVVTKLTRAWEKADPSSTTTSDMNTISIETCISVAVLHQMRARMEAAALATGRHWNLEQQRSLIW